MLWRTLPSHYTFPTPPRSRPFLRVCVDSCLPRDTTCSFGRRVFCICGCWIEPVSSAFYSTPIINCLATGLPPPPPFSPLPVPVPVLSLPFLSSRHMVMQVAGLATGAATCLLLSVPVDGFACGIAVPPARRRKVELPGCISKLPSTHLMIISLIRACTSEPHAPDTSSTLC